MLWTRLPPREAKAPEARFEHQAPNKPVASAAAAPVLPRIMRARDLAQSARALPAEPPQSYAMVPAGRGGLAAVGAGAAPDPVAPAAPAATRASAATDARTPIVVGTAPAG